MLNYISNVYRLGVKELWSLRRDPIMLCLIAYAFTFAIYFFAIAVPGALHNASIAIVDEDDSPLSARIASAFHPTSFLTPKVIGLEDVDSDMNLGKHTFVLDIPPNFQQDVLSKRQPTIQLNVDATNMAQAFTGNAHVQLVVTNEINDFLRRYQTKGSFPVELVLRSKFNQTQTASWFGAIMELINMITMLSVILTGAALIREREHGTIEHLLVMPVTPGEIMLAKIWSMGLVVLLAAMGSIFIVVQGVLQVPIEGSIILFLACAALHLFATTAMGIFIATVARSMPQFGLLTILILLPLHVLSGGITPRESMPVLVQKLMLLAPNTHFVSIAQAILYRGAGFEIVWPQCLILVLMGSLFFVIALSRFRKTISLL